MTHLKDRIEQSLQEVRMVDYSLQHARGKDIKRKPKEIILTFQKRGNRLTREKRKDRKERESKKPR